MSKSVRKLLCLLMAAVFFLPQIPVMCEDDVIEISTAKELTKLAKSCSVDTWSQGKTVYLTKNIDMSGEKFSGIPTFSGSFDGQGYKIRGINLSQNASKSGLFRYISASGMVKNLNAEGTVKPGGTAERIGGIAGSNAGRILDCKFSGTVTGKNYVGGIAGENLAGGTISDCSSAGFVYGEHYIGGVTGQNLGTIISCSNNASVNTAAQKVKLDIKSIDFENLNSMKNTPDITDIGGISGFSSGIIQSCTNEGVVGYRHLGYNIGGIAGRQSGYLDGCTNKGDVYGRKDVGGIAGQIEPYTVLQYSEDTIGSISSELNKLQNALDRTINRAERGTSKVNAKFHEVRSYADDAMDAADRLAKKTEDIINGDAEQINNLSAKMTVMINDVSNALDKTDDVVDSLNSLADNLQAAIDTVDDSFNIEKGTVKSAINELEYSTKQLESASRNLRTALKYFRKSLNELEDMKEHAENLAGAIGDLYDVNVRLGEAFANLAEALGGMASALPSGDSEALKEYCDAAEAAFKTLGNGTNVIALRLKTIKKYARILGDDIKDFNIQNVKRTINSMSAALANLEDAMAGVSDMSANLAKIVDGIDVDSLKTAREKLDAATKSMKKASDGIGEVISETSAALKKLGEDQLITITALDEEYIQTADDLSASISKAFDAVESAGDVITGDLNAMTRNIQEVSDRIMIILNLMVDGIQDSYDVNLKDEISNRTADISEEDTIGQSTGKVSSSNNDGTVEGDVNVGGIAGSLAFEYDFDPEDDIKKTGKRSMEFLYKTRAVVRSCINNGDVTAKKDNVGGIAGLLGLGCVIDSVGRGVVTSTGGDYVGGIAGKCDSVIKNSNSRAILSGDDYVGGIAGEAKNIYDCYSAEHIEDADEYVGGIAGNITGESARNYYCSEAYGAVDSVSYTGVAEPASIDFLMNSKRGDVFRSFTATFRLDDKVIGNIDFDYGESLDISKLPSIPQKNGYYSQWDTEDFENLTHDVVANAEYIPYVTAVESDEKRSGGLAALVCEGMYSEKSELDAKRNATRSNVMYKQIENWTVSVTDNKGDSTKIHYLVPDNTKGKVFIFSSDGSGFNKVKYEKDGQYIVFDGGKEKTEFAVVKKTALWYLAEIAIALMLSVLCIFFGRREIKRTKRRLKKV